MNISLEEITKACEQEYQAGFEAGKLEMMNTINALEGKIRHLEAERNESEKECIKIAEERDEAICVLEATDQANLYLHTEIDKLKEEYDALLKDVTDYQGSICTYCKNFKRDNKAKKIWCDRYGDFPTSEGIPLMCGKWEWRGVNHDD